jgi:2-polyprenyl-3-methyl-5-hydroxy-6-metoxy-1,4-benzoquinol methylase
VIHKREPFFRLLGTHVPIQDKRVLDIGCGDGARSSEIAKLCRLLTGIDPDHKKVLCAIRRGISNASFEVQSAETLSYPANQFGGVFFTLSLHHVPPEHMRGAIINAAATCKEDGHIVIIEPDMEGSFYEAEVRFGICDGDERAAKKAARRVVETHPDLRIINELPGETTFPFRSLRAFVETMHPSRNLAELPAFLEAHREDSEIVLRAPRMIWVCQPNY